MAKLQSETLTISVSKLLRNVDPQSDILATDVLSQLEAIIQELVGPGVLVEVSEVTTSSLE